MYFLFSRAKRIKITQTITSKMKKKIVPEKKGKPKEFTNATSKVEANEIEPGIIPS